MHSHDRTLLARLGFADPDRKDRQHDLACQYLARPETLTKLAELFVPASHPDSNGWTRDHSTVEYHQIEGIKSYRVAQAGPARHEFPLSKGEGQYKTTIGFLDLCAPVEMQCLFDGRERRRSEHAKETDPWGEWVTYHGTSTLEIALIIEVKIASTSAGEVLRQVNLYREYLQFRQYYTKRHWIAATLFDLSSSDKAQLASERVTHVRLGAAFERFVAEQQDAAAMDPSEPSPEV